MKISCILLFGLLLTACGTTHRVAVEPSPSGLRPWQRPYSVDGERYVPLQKVDGFREEGLASWYGTEEHGNRTSNGEVFDMYKLSAAHKTLPLGCHIRVTNKSNGRQAVVRVNDRGPFVSDRIVDLSYRAALDLDIVEHGVAPVAIEVVSYTSGNPVRGNESRTLTVDPVDEKHGIEQADQGLRSRGQDKTGSVRRSDDLRVSRSAGAVKSSKPGFTLQVGAYSDRKKAGIISERLSKVLTAAVVTEVDTGKQHVYRVRAGRFQSRSDAEAALSSLAMKDFPDAFIVTE